MDNATTTAALMHRIDTEGAAILRGLDALTLARRLLEHAVHEAGYSLTFDPASSPDLVDYLTVTAHAGLEGATIGLLVGSLIGLLVKRPAAGAAIGAGLGLVAGAVRGTEDVDRGWRVHAVRTIDGTPSIAIFASEALEASEALWS